MVDTNQEVSPNVFEEDVPADISGMHVLLVEDNELNCEIVQFMLEDAGQQLKSRRTERLLQMSLRHQSKAFLTAF